MNNEKTKRKKLENVRRRRSKPLERDYRISKQGANRSKGTRGLVNKEQTAPKRLVNLRTGRKPLQRNRRRSKPIEKENRDKIICEQVASGSKGTREQNKEQTARKLQENCENKEQAKRKRLENLRTRSKPLAKDYEI